MINISIHESDVFKAIGDALTPVIDGVVIKGLSNKVAPPNGDYTVITPILSERQGTNETSYITDFRSESVLYTYTVQVDCYGRNSGNTANVINMLFRGDYFNDKGLTPLRATNPRQLVFEGDEHQMIERWTQDIDVSYNPAIALPQESAIVLDVGLLYQAD